MTSLTRLVGSPAHLSERDVSGATPLHWAAKSGQLQTVRLLVEAGAGIDARDAAGNTPLHVAAALGHTDVAQYLLAHRHPPSVAGAEGFTPLHLAASAGNSMLVEVLLRAGADVNAANSEGMTPLILAIRGTYTRVAAQLLAAGADPNRATIYGDTALHWAAVISGAADTTELLAAGGNPNALNVAGETPLALAAEFENLDDATQLVKMGATLRPRDTTLSARDASYLQGLEGWTAAAAQIRLGQTTQAARSCQAALPYLQLTETAEREALDALEKRVGQMEIAEGINNFLGMMFRAAAAGAISGVADVGLSHAFNTVPTGQTAHLWLPNVFENYGKPSDPLVAAREELSRIGERLERTKKGWSYCRTLNHAGDPSE